MRGSRTSAWTRSRARRSMKLLLGSTEADPPCVSCVGGKLARHTFFDKGSDAEEALAVVHIDLCGQFWVAAKDGSLYFLLLKDRHSRFKWAMPVAKKSDVLWEFQRWLQNGMAEREMRTIVDCLGAQLLGAVDGATGDNSVPATDREEARPHAGAVVGLHGSWPRGPTPLGTRPLGPFALGPNAHRPSLPAPFLAPQPAAPRGPSPSVPLRSWPRGPTPLGPRPLGPSAPPSFLAPWPVAPRPPAPRPLRSWPHGPSPLGPQPLRSSPRGPTRLGPRPPPRPLRSQPLGPSCYCCYYCCYCYCCYYCYYCCSCMLRHYGFASSSRVRS
ncbi:unnamed protein product [Closterium sp. NIES-54]